MTARGWNHQSQWEQMNEEYNSTMYDAQYADEDVNGAVELDHCRLYITNIPKMLSTDGLRMAFSKYGTLVEVYLSKDPQKKYGLVKFETPGEAKLAMTKLNRTEPLKLNVFIAHKPKKTGRDQPRERHDREGPSTRTSIRDDTSSIDSRPRNMRKQMELANGDDLDDDVLAAEEFDVDILDPETHLELEQIKLKQLELQEKQVRCKQRMLLIKQSKKAANMNTSSNRCILPDGRIVVRNVNDRNLEPRDADTSYSAGAGDSNERNTICSRRAKNTWDETSEGTSTPSTCVFCSEDSKQKDTDKSSKYTELSKKSCYSKITDSKTTVNSIKTNEHSKKSNSKFTDIITRRSVNRKLDTDKGRKSEISCGDFYSDSEDNIDETNRLIQLRNSDYMDIVEDNLKIVIALAGYPKSKMRLRQMKQFQKCITDVIDMQLKAGLLKKVPTFLDYYLNRGAIICICKDIETRNWMVRVNPGLQERMSNNLILLKTKVKRLCLAVLKIPRSCWPATAQDTFKLLQYFNPALKTDMWKIYSQKFVDNIEITSFVIDRVSGEIIRGPNFKNVIDYDHMDFEMTGYAEIYYECLLSDSDEDLSSVASRVKLLEEFKSEETTPKVLSEVSVTVQKYDDREEADDNENEPEDSDTEVEVVEIEVDKPAIKKQLESSLQEDILKDVKYISEKDEVIIWSDETNNYNSDQETEKNDKNNEDIQEANEVSTSALEVSDKTDSVYESNDNLFDKNSNLNIDSNRGMAYHRRTNYLHVDNELKVAMTLEGYPQNKLEGTHIRRLKHLFKEYMHKDMKQLRFANLIIPKFQDVYLSNGAVIYICDSLETKDYLSEILPKFVNSTGLKLTFRDMKSLVRYTRIVMRIPKEKAHIESLEILLKLQTLYPALKPDCWKYYSDVVGKQKRQFGVDPESLEVIKRPDFEPIFEGHKITFRIIDRQKRDTSFDESIKDDFDTDNQRQELLRKMYIPIDPDITNAPLSRIRTNHYSDVIADDLKLYIGPSNYPESRIDEVQFYTIKKNLENIVLNLEFDSDIPKLHDMYLFDGVIFIICHDMQSRQWLEQSLDALNTKLRTNLKSTEFRGAVGIISMVVKTKMNTDEVIEILQKQNPRLRTKFWRTISTVHTKTKLDVVLQIDKLSAQVITSSNFNKYIGSNIVQFKLGHLQSLIKSKVCLEESAKVYVKTPTVPEKEVLESQQESADESKHDFQSRSELKIDRTDSQCIDDKAVNIKIIDNCKKAYSPTDKSELDPVIIEMDSPRSLELPEDIGNRKINLKIPMNILPDEEEDLNVIFNLLEDKNPGLNTELWEVYSECPYPNNGKFTVIVDRQSFSVIQQKSFDSTIGGEKLRFLF
ncbi:uncharacterized protein LOC131849019 [Achroia grisella]|uniref:uncharacterized protein LOC131849019 n=1 Tax=Achroia grisella TaxID=688607 RepID=UPI0027D29019|nr:uncharacterized protein LOC131849019 [Achroia grisella]XP_059054978.1 uncharacterized protein LOC131849019 [Achroia grisella]